MTREPWDFEAFVRAYDRHAREAGGWSYDPDDASRDRLQEWYESTALWDSIADFARTRFQLDQQI